MKHTRMRIVMAAIATSALACSAQTQSGTGIVLSDAETVTELPPDTMPSDAYSNMDPDDHASRDVVMVLFDPGTSLENKRRAIASINGRVVGGTKSGAYAIRISRNSRSMDRVDNACSKLFKDQVVTTCMRMAVGNVDGNRHPPTL